MTTLTAFGRVYDFSHSVGRASISGTGLISPIKPIIGEGDVVYVLNRGQEGPPGGGPLVPNGYGARVSKFTIGTVPGDEEFVTEFGRNGDEPGQFTWPAGIATDSKVNVYVTDEWLNRVSIFDKDGTFLRIWGASGGGDGEFNGACGIAINEDDELYIVDSRNHRIQKMTKDGKYLAKWGSFGTNEGEFNTPWGIGLDRQGNVYVADHKNDRVQKFTPSGEFVAQYGGPGAIRGQLKRPSDVHVDPDGDIYVCEWINNRVQIFGQDGKLVTTLIGDAQELSKWSKMTVEANADVVKARRRVKSLEPEWRFALPTGLVFDGRKGRLLVADTQRSRLQIYNKLKDYLEPQFNL